MGHLETGRKDFRISSVKRVANALGVTMSELFDDLEAGSRGMHTGQPDKKPIKKIKDNLAGRGSPWQPQTPAKTA